MRRLSVYGLSLLLATAVFAARGQEGRTLVIRNARIVPVSAPPIERGIVVIAAGRIAALGARVPIPAGAEVLDATGLSLYPGMIELDTRVGLSEIGQVSVTRDTTDLGDFSPQLVAVTAFNVESAHIGVTRANGVTTVLCGPSGNVIPGQATLFDLRGWTAREMASRERGALVVEWPRAGGFGGFGRGGGGGGQEVPARLEALRRFLADAKAYQAGSGTPNLAFEAMQPYLRGELPVIIKAVREADLRAAIDLAAQYGLKLVLAGALEAPQIAGLLKEKNVGVLYGPLFGLPLDTEDPYDSIYTGPATLHKEGVRFALSTGGDTANCRNLPYHAAAAAAFGLPEDAALRAVTLVPVEPLDIEKEYGSLDVGKVANCFLATGSPLDHRTQIPAVFIRGHQVDLSSRHEALYRKYLPRVEGGTAR